MQMVRPNLITSRIDSNNPATLFQTVDTEDFTVFIFQNGSSTNSLENFAHLLEHLMKILLEQGGTINLGEVYSKEDEPFNYKSTEETREEMNGAKIKIEPEMFSQAEKDLKEINSMFGNTLNEMSDEMRALKMEYNDLCVKARVCKYKNRVIILQEYVKEMEGRREECVRGMEKEASELERRAKVQSEKIQQLEDENKILRIKLHLERLQKNSAARSKLNGK